MWHFELSGNYSVRSGYYTMVDFGVSSSTFDQSSLIRWWKSLWYLQILGKVKVFTWRFYHNLLPLKQSGRS